MDPKDTIEMMLVSQFVVCNFKSMESIGRSYINSQTHGLMFMRMSHSILDMLSRYRNRTLNKFQAIEGTYENQNLEYSS